MSDDKRAQLYIGNKNYSSWSLRPWLCLRWAGIEFDEVFISLGQEGYGRGEIAEVLAVSPSGRVPALRAGPVQLWDSLAIAEWAAEQAPKARLWPGAPVAKAVARSIACEMHSGFGHLRQDLPMNINRRVKVPDWSKDTQREINRVIKIWEGCLAHDRDGPWLFGHRGIADAFYAPIVTRFRTYGVDLPEASAAYSATLFADEHFLAWEASPVTEGFDFIDDLYPEPK